MDIGKILNSLSRLAEDINAGNWLDAFQTVLDLAGAYLQQERSATEDHMRIVAAATPGTELVLSDDAMVNYLRAVAAPDSEHRKGIGSSILGLVLPIIMKWAIKKFFG